MGKRLVFLFNFLRNGRIEYDMASQYIENKRTVSTKLFALQELDSQSDGIFLVGPFPYLMSI